jgi:hypothetical protein
MTPIRSLLDDELNNDAGIMDAAAPAMAVVLMKYLLFIDDFMISLSNTQIVE